MGAVAPQIPGVSQAALDAETAARAAADSAEATARGNADAALAAAAATDAELAAHEADTTNIHGIADTSVLETLAGAQAKADAAAQSGRRLGNRVLFLGDSITIGNTARQAAYDQVQDRDITYWAHLLSEGRVIPLRNGGVAGNTSTQMRARIATDVIPYAPDWCVVMAGSNTVALSQYVADITGICSDLRAAGIRPVLCTPPPTPSGVVRQTTERMSAWLKAFASRNQVPLIDTRLAVQDPATGGYYPEYDNGDGLHPNAAGAKALGQTIATALASMLPAWSPPVAGMQTTDAANLLSNGLFLTDSNADGTPDGWTKSGGASAVVSLLAGDPGIRGNWMRIYDAVSESITMAGPGFAASGNFAVGDRIAYTGRIRNEGGAGSNFIVSLLFNGPGSVYSLLYQWGPTPIDNRPFYFETVIPPSTTSVAARLTLAGGNVDFRIAQLQILNLTGLGVIGG